MTATSRRIIAALLLIPYGLISACGSGAHALLDGAHQEAHSAEDGDHHAASLSSSDHGDCLICHHVGQGQLLPPADPIAAKAVASDDPPPKSPAPLPSSHRLPSDPRAPPLPLA